MFVAGRYWRVFPGLVVGVVLWTYLPALSHRYVWDDVTLFSRNGSPPRVGFVREHFCAGAGRHHLLSAPVLAMPVSLLEFRVDRRKSSRTVSTSRFIWLTSGSCIGSVCAFSSRPPTTSIRTPRESSCVPLSRPPWRRSFIILHPALAEATAWVAGRFDFDDDVLSRCWRLLQRCKSIDRLKSLVAASARFVRS